MITIIERKSRVCTSFLLSPTWQCILFLILIPMIVYLWSKKKYDHVVGRIKKCHIIFHVQNNSNDVIKYTKDYGKSPDDID